MKTLEEEPQHEGKIDSTDEDDWYALWGLVICIICLAIGW